MKKVVNASVGGRSFAIDEDAYARLVAYFDHFKDRLLKKGETSQSSTQEVMSDLESRIAELFSQGTGGAAYRVVDIAIVTKVVETLGMPDGSKEEYVFTRTNADSASSAQGNPSESQQGSGQANYSGNAGSGPDFSYSGVKGDSRKRLFRDSDNKAIGGVCSGLAAFLNIDITIVRIIVLLAMLCYGAGLMIYLVLWIVVPIAKTPADKCQMRGLEPTAENMAGFSGQGRAGNGK